MKIRSATLTWVSLGFLFAAVLLTVFQLVSYSRIRASFASGTEIAGVPVGGLTRQAAADRLMQVYGLPVELYYGDDLIQIKPATAGFELNLEAMLTEADQKRVDQPFWVGFWDYLWNRTPSAGSVPLSYKLSEERLRLFLTGEVAARYDTPPEASMPIPGTTSFQPGRTGTQLDVERAIPLIEDALSSPTTRVVNLSVNRTDPSRPSIQNLQVLLQQTIDLSGFDGYSEIYLLDLQTNQELNFGYSNGQSYPAGVAFTAASTMKVPIMVSIFRQLNEPTPAEAANLMELMIKYSENDPADRLMETYLDTNLGPLEVTDDLTTLGLENTFIAGYFYPGAPLLRRIATPANQRTDLFTDPDSYNQTTSTEMGMLLNDIYQCAQSGSGTFAAAFPGQISQAECRTMISYLASNRIGVLIQAGLPDGTQVAHKHGWITELDGVIHTISDSGIVYTSSGNFILVIYMWHPNQLVFDDANLLFSKLTQGIYNYFVLAAR